jgi:hypothetical protein
MITGDEVLVTRNGDKKTIRAIPRFRITSTHHHHSSPLFITLSRQLIYGEP